MRKLITIINIWLFSIVLVYSQAPAGYYDSASGLSGEPLRTALYNIIKNHNQQSYAGLWTLFQQTDKKSNGKVWDMYSLRADGTSSYEYTFVNDQCGNYSGEGSCYNREHSFPKSWFNDSYPEYTDMFHLYPTDGYVNGQRSNLPYGEVNTASWTSTNGSKKGTCSYPGYTGTVFEPIDEFKGDFARSYFYMLTRYKLDVNTWNSDMLSGDNFASWAKNMLLEWNAQDPVSTKEINRNNVIYGIQNNRNPYIDHPEWAVAVWDPTSSIIDIKEKPNLNIWYSENLIRWNVNRKNGTLNIYNVLGQKIETIQVVNGKTQQEVSFNKGIYLAEFSSEFKIVVKFVVK